MEIPKSNGDIAVHKQLTTSSWRSSKQLGKRTGGEGWGAHLCGQRQQHQLANTPTGYVFKMLLGESLRKSQETDLTRMAYQKQKNKEFDLINKEGIKKWLDGTL